MPTIIWEGNKKEFGTSHKCSELPENAVKLRESDGFIGKAMLYGIAPMMICMMSMPIKVFLNKQSPIDPLFLIPAFVIGFIIALPLHEIMHALCYPKGATVWIGLYLRKLAAYAISYHPLTKTRFIIMSLAPSVLGIIPLVLFIVLPISMKPLLTICFISAFMGLISPTPDYMDILSVIKNVPNTAMIQDTPNGLFFYDSAK